MVLETMVLVGNKKGTEEHGEKQKRLDGLNEGYTGCWKCFQDQEVNLSLQERSDKVEKITKKYLIYRQIGVTMRANRENVI